MWPRRKRWSLMGGGRSYLASDRVTPKYDIHIGQHGKPRLDILKLAPSGGSGHHPGFESGYQGGVYGAIPSPIVEGAEEVRLQGGNAGLSADQNKIPTIMARQASQTPFYEYEAEHSTSPVVAARKGGKKSNKLKYIVEALQELEGETPEKLAMSKGYGRAMPAAQGFSLATMGGRLGEQEAMAKARREEELRRRMKLMGGGY